MENDVPRQEFDISDMPNVGHPCVASSKDNADKIDRLCISSSLPTTGEKTRDWIYHLRSAILTAA